MTPRAPKSSARIWNPLSRPPCFGTAEAWGEWLAHRQGAHSPCEDCTPTYKRAQMDKARCIRPETVFLRGDGGVFGVSADDPRFAALLMGQSIPDGNVIGPGVEGERWKRLLKLIERRAHMRVRTAIGIWMRRQRAGTDKGRTE